MSAHDDDDDDELLRMTYDELKVVLMHEITTALDEGMLIVDVRAAIFAVGLHMEEKLQKSSPAR